MKLLLSILTLVSLSFGFTKVDKLVLSGPFASVSHPIAYMIENGTLNDVAKKVEFTMWKNPDELRAMTIKGGADFIALPTNVGANLYNKGVKTKLINVSVWGILGIVSTDKKINSLADLKGKKLVVPFRGDMLDIVLRTLLKKQGIDAKKDLKIVYVATPMDAVRMIIAKKANNAVLVEPAISMALAKAKKSGINLHRSVDLQKVWGKTFNTKEEIAQAGMAEVGTHDPHIVKRFNEEYGKALEWYKTHPKEAGKLTQKYFPMLKAGPIAMSIPNIKLKNVSGYDAKKQLEFFFEILKADNPKLIGGKLPDDGFYYKP